MEELLSFFALYYDENSIFGMSLGITMLILYGTAGFYILDFYMLMKKKSGHETAAIMIIPITVSVMGAALVSMLIHVPGPDGLEKFSAVLHNRGLNGRLLILPVLYLLLWGLWFFLRRNQNREHMIRWCTSCALDYACVLLILLCAGINVITGASIFAGLSPWILWLFLHAVWFLGCKIVLLLVGLINSLYSARIRIFRWKEGKNPSGFLFRYFCIYQNAIFREISLFELGILIPLTLGLANEGWTLQGVEIMGFLYICGIFMILFSMRTTVNAMSRFRKWGNPKALRRLFCEEYFRGEKVYQDANYTVTRHFLVDENSPAAVYYFPKLTSVGGWVINKKGKSRTLTFSDGEACRFTKEETESAERVVAYGRRWLDGDLFSYDQKSTEPEKLEKFYGNIFQKAIVAVLVLIFVVGQAPNLFFSSAGGDVKLTGKKPLYQQDKEVKVDFEDVYLITYYSYEYDKKDRLVTLTEYSAKDYDATLFHERFITTNTYDEEGRLSYQEYANVQNEGSYNIYTTKEYTYLEDGYQEVENTSHNKYIRRFDRSGNLISYQYEEYYRGNGVIEYGYDEKNRMLYRRTLNGKGELTGLLLLDWNDAEHTCTILEYDDPDGFPVAAWLETYTEEGKKLTSVYRDLTKLTEEEQLKFLKNPRDFCYPGYWADYDGDGNLVEIVEQGGNPKVGVYPFGNNTYTANLYDEQGRKEWEYRYFDGFLYMTHYFYNKKGNLSEAFVYRIYTKEWKQEMPDGSTLCFFREKDSKYMDKICRYTSTGMLLHEVDYLNDNIWKQWTTEGTLYWQEPMDQIQ